MAEDQTERKLLINIKMKPCPFCGNTEISIHKNLVLSYFAYCTRCNAQGPPVMVYHDYENDGENGERNLAAKRWNERESPIVETEEKKQAAT